MCENLLTRGYLYECNSTYIWMLVAIIIFMFIMTTVAVILIIGKIKQKHKQKRQFPSEQLWYLPASLHVLVSWLSVFQFYAFHETGLCFLLTAQAGWLSQSAEWMARRTGRLAGQANP